MVELDSRRVVERYLHEVLAGHGPAALHELVSNPLLRDRIGAFRAAFPDVAVTPRVIFVDGENVAVHLSAAGTHHGTFEGVPGTGRRWTASCTALYRVEAGRIADFWVNWDVLAILEQLGAIRRADGASA